jgi:hypothetical protein
MHESGSEVSPSDARTSRIREKVSQGIIYLVPGLYACEMHERGMLRRYREDTETVAQGSSILHWKKGGRLGVDAVFR